VKGEWAENNLVDIAAPVLIFWVFIYDMTHITVARIVTERCGACGTGSIMSGGTTSITASPRCSGAIATPSS